MFIRLLSVLIATQALSLSTALAGIVVTVQDAVISPNSSGYVDILISSTDGSDVLAGYYLTLQISPNSPDNLNFDSTVNQPDVRNETNYVFYNNSDSFSYDIYNDENENGGDPWDAYVSDATSDGTNITLSTTAKLLHRLAVVHTTADDPSTTIGDVYTVTILDVGGSSGLLDEDFNVLSLDGSSKLSGNITIAPEPGSVAILGSLVVVGFGLRRSRRTLHRQKIG